MKRPVAVRARTASRLLTRWYLAPTGFLYVATAVAGGLVAATLHRGVGAAMVAVSVLIVLPYKLARSEDARLAAARGGRALSTRLSKLESRVAEMGGRVAAAEGRTQQVRKDLLGSVATAKSEMTLLLRSERMIWTDALTNSTDDLRRDLTEVAERLERAERADLARLDDVGGRLDDIGGRLAALDRESDDQSTRLDRERAQRRLAGARRDAARRPVDGVLLLICPQRVGSTWLFDMLRHHRGVEIFPTADVARLLGMSGRRYPAHLSDACSDGLEVEVQDGVGGLVPAVSWSGAFVPDDTVGFAIEKVHPSAIAFDADRFVDRVDKLRGRLGADRVRALYLVRDPVQSVRSFVAYRRRIPAWHVDVPERHVHDFYRRSYDVIAAIHERLPGHVVAYEHLRADPVNAFAELLLSLELEKTEIDARRSADAAVAATSMATRPERNPFFSSDADVTPSALEVELGVGTDDPGRAQASVARCRDVIRVLMPPLCGSSWRADPR